MLLIVTDTLFRIVKTIEQYVEPEQDQDEEDDDNEDEEDANSVPVSQLRPCTTCRCPSKTLTLSTHYYIMPRIPIRSTPSLG